MKEKLTIVISNINLFSDNLLMMVIYIIFVFLFFCHIEVR